MLQLIPLQDSPQVRVTYSAPSENAARASRGHDAENDPQAPRDGDYSFKMSQPIPSYLIALAVGEASL